MQRREFLMTSGRAALGLPFAPMSARVQGSQRSAGAADLEGVVAALETEISELMSKAQVPGLSIALAKDGALVWRRGFGVKDVRSKEPVDDATVFEAASTSKPVFAYAVMKLCENGVMDLDTPLAEYTSERLIDGDPRVEQITARHVLSHTSGLPNWRSKQQPLAIRFQPGEKWDYSGEGYSYLQAAVSSLTGGRTNRQACGTFELGLEFCATEPSFDEFMQRSVLSPFGMSSSGFLWTRAMEDNIAWGHDPKGRPLKESRKPNGPALARYGAAGGMSTTPSDYVKFLMEIVAAKGPDAFRLTRASLDEMLRPQVKRTAQNSWALGWAITHTPTGDLISHGGGNPGYSCFVAASVERKSGYVIMTNLQETGFTDVIAKLIAGDTLSRFLGGKVEP